ncbi:unnamed protein product [Bemisia tabaci]|uniref:C2H2-type domain-containing protein n=1 Tax=Bemisia tabaci TaxID=7038 RepID=A0A9P0A058_BEMTA|nr:unnamed protein product [Bemisia tabaci]
MGLARKSRVVIDYNRLVIVDGIAEVRRRHNSLAESWSPGAASVYKRYPTTVARGVLEEDLFSCDLCLKSYKYRQGLNRHKKYECTYVGSKPQFSCPHCPFLGKQKVTVTKHIILKHPGKSTQVQQKVVASTLPT